MSIFEDDAEKKPVAHEVGSDLSLLSVDELKERIDLLREEIVRLEAEMKAKQSSKTAAESLFR
ncbi:MAG: DUF1192 domain-containing protein [Alphaproteobacteria bacterium]|nr:DUF1192 domain-containing protein [Alphaproteobacteria bacterium]